jgi:DNA-binding transcriptional MerR regulator
LSKATGVKVVTIRYYEHVKLMPEPARTEGNYRIYSRAHLHRLQFVRRCRDLGFTLDQLQDQPQALHVTPAVPMQAIAQRRSGGAW